MPVAGDGEGSRELPVGFSDSLDIEKLLDGLWAVVVVVATIIRLQGPWKHYSDPADWRS